jgi:hypothetical protein
MAARSPVGGEGRGGIGGTVVGQVWRRPARLVLGVGVRVVGLGLGAREARGGGDWTRTRTNKWARVVVGGRWQWRESTYCGHGDRSAGRAPAGAGARRCLLYCGNREQGDGAGDGPVHADVVCCHCCAC